MAEKPQQPRWRQVYDKVDKEVSPKVTDVVQSDTFNVVNGLVVKARKTVGRQIAGATAQLWHLVNLPAGTDVKRLRKQVGSLDREVRRLTIALERERRGSDGDPRDREADD